MTRRVEAKHQGEQLTPYGLKHCYAKGMHAANVPIANICEAMGYTIGVHLKAYARFKPNATGAAPDEAAQGLVADAAKANRLMIYPYFRL